MRHVAAHQPLSTGDQLELLSDTGTLRWSDSWAEPGWVFSFFGTQGTFVDDGATIEGTHPGFADEAAGDDRLLASAPLPPSGAVGYLARGRSAGGAGSWGAGRDAELDAAPGGCAP